LQAYSISGVRPDVRLIISGSPDEQIMEKIARLGLASDVFFKELSTDQQLSDVYRGAVAFLFPSLYEGFGLPPLEAMACGVPVLSSNVSSLPEVLSDAAILVDPLDLQEISDGIQRLVRDSSLRAHLRGKGLLRAQVFTWEETVRKTSRALQFALVSNSAPRHARADAD
jgi:glycosyltransferase involved in cell wall biosynthesis